MQLVREVISFRDIRARTRGLDHATANDIATVYAWFARDGWDGDYDKILVATALSIYGKDNANHLCAIRTAMERPETGTGT